MADTVEFELVSPQRLVLSEPVEMVVVPGAEGDVGVLPGHSPLICSVRPGVIDIHEQGSVRESIFVAGGFAEVSPERCTVLAEEAVPVSEIDQGEAQARLEAARTAEADADDEGRPAAEAERRIAEAMVAAAASA
jgi:F-type H+-transporting ATPase subunit epsilon